MNSQRGKASTNASRQNKSQKSGQIRKSQTYANKYKQPLKNFPAPKKSPQVSSAVAYATTQNTGKARVIRTDYDSCKINHRELIGSLTGTVNFANGLVFAINPGITNTFPWLSTQALGWEKYKFTKFHVCSYPRCSSATNGSIMMSPDYDAADSVPLNEAISSTYYGTVEDAPWKEIRLVLDPKRLQAERYIRTGPLSANLDIKTYDVANVFINTTDGSAINWSKIWVEYEVILMNPQLPSSGVPGSGTVQGAGGSIAAATPFGAVPIFLGSYLTGLQSGNVLLFSGLTVGVEYLLSMHFIGTAITSVNTSGAVGVTGRTGDFIVSSNGLVAECFLTLTATSSSGTIPVNIAATTITSSQGVLSAIVPTPGF